MTGLLWKDGRLSWGVIGVVVFLTVSVIAFDLAWRAVKIPFEKLLIYAVIIDVAAAVVVVVVSRLIPRERRPA